ncbi:MAG: WHG domain-containing protein [Propionicimonas sp.]
MTRAALTSAIVVATAAELADQAGFDEVSLSAVARHLGVRAPSLYAHVRDLAALRDAIAESALCELNDRISLGIAGRSGADALRGFADAHRAFARESPGRWDSLQRQTGDAVAASVAARTVVALTDAVLRGYELPPAERVHAIRLLGSTINGFLNLERAGSFDHSTPSSQVSWNRAIDALDAVLRGWPAGTTGKAP